MSCVIVSHTYVEPENRGKLRALARTEHVTAVVPARWRESALRRAWRQGAAQLDGGVQIVPVPWHGAFRPAAGFMRVPRALTAGAVVQIEEEPWTPTAWALARSRPGAACVLFTWENLDRRFPWPWSAMQRAVWACVDGVIAGSRGAADVARAQGYGGPLAVIPQLGVDLPARTARPASDALRVAYVGRLVPEKGIDTLLRALARLEMPWQLSIVGDGPERGALTRLAADLQLAARVRFLGARPHDRVAELWREVDVLVLPSLSTPRWKEQLGHILLEAMAATVACVGSSCGAIPDVLADAGLLFPEGDDQALAAHLRALASDRSLVERLRETGRRRVEKEFTNDRIAARTLTFHHDVLGARPR